MAGAARVVTGALAFAARCERPAFIGVSRPRAAAKKLGLAFEKKVGKELKTSGIPAVHGQWFEYTDSRGTAWCQPDFLLPRRDLGAVFVVEVKLSWVPEAEEKLRGLYLPVVAKALKCKTYGIVLCKNLRPGAPEASLSLQSAVRAALGNTVSLFSWASGPLITQVKQSTAYGVSPS